MTWTPLPDGMEDGMRCGMEEPIVAAAGVYVGAITGPVVVV